MPYQVNNTFRPASQFGAPIQALTRAMFSGATPEEREAKLAAAEANRAHAGYYDAQTSKTRAEAAAAAEAARRAQDPVANFVNNVFGAERGAEVTNFQRGVRTDQYRGSDGEDGPATVMAPAARPGWLSPKDEAALNEQARVIAIANNLTGKTSGNGYDDIAKTIRIGAAQDAVMAGADPTRTAQAFGSTSGKMPFQQGQFGMGNELTGDLADPRLFNSAVALTGEKRNTELTEQQQRRAAANASNASAGEHSARAADVRAGATLVPVIDPVTRTPMLDANNQPIMVRQADRGKALQGGEVKIAVGDNTAANKPPGAKAMRMINPAQVELEVNRALGVSLDKTTGKPREDSELPLAPALLARVKQRAAEIYGSSSTGNLTDAVNQAVAEAGDLVPETTPGRLYGTNPTGRRTSNAAPAPAAAPNPNARQIAPPAQAAPAAGIPEPAARKAGQVYPTPRGPMKWTGTGWVPAAPGVDS